MFIVDTDVHNYWSSAEVLLPYLDQNKLYTSYRFDEPGEYLLICHEYCGLGHHMMYGRIIVEPAGTEVPLVGGDLPLASAPSHSPTH